VKTSNSGGTLWFVLFTHPPTPAPPHKAVQLKSKLLHTGTLSAATWLHRCLRYRPAVFFRHFISLRFHFRKENFGANFKNVTFYFFKIMCLKLRNQKLPQSGSVCSEQKYRLV
jgi:hypothetical protein